MQFQPPVSSGDITDLLEQVTQDADVEADNVNFHVNRVREIQKIVDF